MTDGRKSGQSKKGPARAETPALEWTAAALGLLLTLGILGAMVWEAIAGDSERPPVLEARVERVVPAGGGHIVEIELQNRSPSTAAAVEIEGTLTKADGTSATSSTTVDYVPGRSSRRAGLFFVDDPGQGRLDIRALGYAEP